MNTCCQGIIPSGVTPNPLRYSRQHRRRPMLAQAARDNPTLIVWRPRPLSCGDPRFAFDVNLAATGLLRKCEHATEQVSGVR